MRRAKTVTGLFLQYLRARWAGLGKAGKLLVGLGLVLGTFAVFQFGACMFGGCPSRRAPCELRADEPCPYSGRVAAQEEAPPEESPEEGDGAEDRPPCH